MPSLQRVDDGEEPVRREGGQREYGHPDGHVLDGFGEDAERTAPRPGLHRVHCGGEGQAGRDHQQVCQCQGEDISGISYGIG